MHLQPCSPKAKSALGTPIPPPKTRTPKTRTQVSAASKIDALFAPKNTVSSKSPAKTWPYYTLRPLPKEQRGANSRGWFGVEVTSSKPIFLKEKKAPPKSDHEIPALFAVRKIPNVVQLIGFREFGKDGMRRQQLVFDVAGNGQLYDYLTKQGALTEDEAAKKALKMAQSLAEIHSLGIAHLDLKAENYVVNDDKDFVLVDFGSCAFTKHEKGPVLATGVRGSPHYAAPEIGPFPATKELAYDGEKADAFSFGVLLFVMTTYGLPFADRDAVLSKGQVTYPSTMSPALKDLIAKLLERDPRRRITVTDALKHDWFRGHRFTLRDRRIPPPGMSTPASSSPSTSSRAPRWTHAALFSGILSQPIR